VNNEVLDVGKAHQRVIREAKQKESVQSASIPKDVDIKKAICKEITFEESKKIILEYEWLGTMGTTQKHYGIFYDNVLAGTICFGYFQAMNRNAYPVGEEYKKKGVQLSRGACTWWAHPHSASKLIGYGLREMAKQGYKYVIAFSDPEAGEIGTVYQATNWAYMGHTEHKHYDLYYSSGKLYMNDRDIFKKYGFSGKVKMQEFIKDKPELTIRQRNAKSRYIKLIGNKKENKIMLQNIGFKLKPYPKRKTN